MNQAPYTPLDHWEAWANKPQSPKPCRSPYCECTPGQCLHPGCYDARAEPFEHPTPAEGLVAWVDALFDAIKHGDQDHQNWLQEKLKSWVIANPPTQPATPAKPTLRVRGWVWKHERCDGLYVPSYTPAQHVQRGELWALVDPNDLHQPLENTDWFAPQEQIADPCPGCPPGQVCRTFACGRLQLPLDHPLRNTQ